VSDLQDIIASNTVRAFNAGYAAGRQEVLAAVQFVKFERDDLEVVAISDLMEELDERAKVYQSNTDFSASEQGKRGNDETR
jgi:hypothetical protein